MRLRLLAPALVLAGLPLPAFAHPPMARVDAALLRATAPVTTFVHSGTTEAAASAARRAGLRVVERYDAIGVVVAKGLPAAVRRAAQDRRVSYLEDADLPITFDLDNAGKATRNTEAQAVIHGPNYAPLSGQGVSVAVIDTGIDGTHPFLNTNGRSAVVANLKDVCTDVGSLLAPPSTCWVAVPGNDSDDASAGGHGTHVAGIVAGRTTVVHNRLSGATRTLTGAAPRANLVGLSIGYGLKITGGTSGMNWVLEHHDAPCGVPSAACPPIRVVNNSWGNAGGSAFSPDSTLVKLQRALVAAGVVVVWAAGNDGGDGSGKDTTNHVQSQLTNGPGNDPTPGVLMVAAYDDGGTGSSDASLAYFSSRGTKGQLGTYPDLAAPGSNILSSCRPTLSICTQGADPWDGPGATDYATFNTLSGTSMATPYISGVVAEMFQLDRKLTPAGVEQVLENGAHRFGDGYEPDPLNSGSPTSFDKGHGLVDVLASADIAQKRVPRPQNPAACGTTAWTDAADDATDVETLKVAGPNHPSADLRSGHWEWDGYALTAVFVLADVSPAGRGLGETGDYVNWTVQLGTSSNLIHIVGGSGSTASFYVYDSDQTTTAQPTLRGRVVDQPGIGSDEIRVTLTNADVAALQGGLPPLSSGLKLTTTAVDADYTLGAMIVNADTARGGCPVILTR